MKGTAKIPGATRTLVLLAVLGIAWGLASLPELPAQTKPDAAQPAAGLQAAAQSPTYQQVAPILERHCVRCHTGAAAPKGLRLGTRAEVLAGATSGPVVVPGKPAQSDLVKHIVGTSQPRMPMGGPPWLSDQETAVIQNWVAAGAP